MKGKIKTLTSKGFGFITPEDGSKDIFFHASGIVAPMRFDNLRVGEVVEYETEESEKGPKAVGVVLV